MNEYFFHYNIVNLLHQSALIYIDFKEKGQKEEMAGAIEKETASELLWMIGHIAIFYRQQKDHEKRKINVPKR